MCKRTKYYCAEETTFQTNQHRQLLFKKWCLFFFCYFYCSIINTKRKWKLCADVTTIYKAIIWHYRLLGIRLFALFMYVFTCFCDILMDVFTCKILVVASTMRLLRQCHQGLIKASKLLRSFTAWVIIRIMVSMQMWNILVLSHIYWIMDPLLLYVHLMSYNFTTRNSWAVSHCTKMYNRLDCWVDVT